MGLPIVNNYPPQVLLVGLNVQQKKSSCTFRTGYGLEYIGFTSSFNSKSTGSVFQVPSVPLNNSSNFCDNCKNSLCCVIVRC